MTKEHKEMLDLQPRWVHEQDLKNLRAGRDNFIRAFGEREYNERLAYAESKVQ